jgi:hypothetical protein
MTSPEIHYTDAQYIALRALAAAHGHGWATESDMPTTHPIPGGLWTRSLIAQMYAEIGRLRQWEPWQCGICAPEAPHPSSMVVRHTTMTGRITWQVDPGGNVGVVVSRPGEEYLQPGEDEPRRRSWVVLSARVHDGQCIEIRTPDTRDHRVPDAWGTDWSPDGGPRAEARHGSALLGALAALIGRPAAVAALDCAGVVVDPPTSDVPASSRQGEITAGTYHPMSLQPDDATRRALICEAHPAPKVDD